MSDTVNMRRRVRRRHRCTWDWNIRWTKTKNCHWIHRKKTYKLLIGYRSYIQIFLRPLTNLADECLWRASIWTSRKSIVSKCMRSMFGCCMRRHPAREGIRLFTRHMNLFEVGMCALIERLDSNTICFQDHWTPRIENIFVNVYL